MLLPVSVVFSFLLFSGIPLCGYTTGFSSALLLMANLPGLLPAGAIMNKAVINIWYQSFSAHIYFGKSLGISLQDHTVGEYLVFLFPHKSFTHNKILILKIQFMRWVLLLPFYKVMDTQIIRDKTKV